MPALSPSRSSSLTSVGMQLYWQALQRLSLKWTRMMSHLLRSIVMVGDALISHLKSTRWELLVERSGITRSAMEELARLYGRSNATIFAWAMGITHHENGVENVQSISNLALIRGMVGKPSAGLMPIRGHSNVQGVGSVGVTPTLSPAIKAGVERTLNISLPDSPGRDTMACMEGAHDGSLTSAICLGGNLYGSNPDTNWAAEALSKLEQIVYISTTLNTGHAWGTGVETIILPARARDEEEQPTTQESMFNFVRLSDGGPERLQGPRSELDIAAALASDCSFTRGL